MASPAASARSYRHKWCLCCSDRRPRRPDRQFPSAIVGRTTASRCSRRRATAKCRRPPYRCRGCRVIRVEHDGCHHAVVFGRAHGYRARPDREPHRAVQGHGTSSAPSSPAAGGDVAAALPRPAAVVPIAPGRRRHCAIARANACGWAAALPARAAQPGKRRAVAPDGSKRTGSPSSRSCRPRGLLPPAIAPHRPTQYLRLSMHALRGGPCISVICPQPLEPRQVAV